MPIRRGMIEENIQDFLFDVSRKGIDLSCFS